MAPITSTKPTRKTMKEMETMEQIGGIIMEAVGGVMGGTIMEMGAEGTTEED
jgi:hypothetical protein